MAALSARATRVLWYHQAIGFPTHAGKVIGQHGIQTLDDLDECYLELREAGLVDYALGTTGYVAAEDGQKMIRGNYDLTDLGKSYK